MREEIVMGKFRTVLHSPEKVAKRAIYLAWKASSVEGMGFLRDNPEATEDDVWKAANSADYPSDSKNPRTKGNKLIISADYVFGRMMKLLLVVTEDSIEYRDDVLRIEYESWCDSFNSYPDLLAAAEMSLG